MTGADGFFPTALFFFCFAEKGDFLQIMRFLNEITNIFAGLHNKNFKITSTL